MKTRQNILYGIFAVVFALAFTACDNGSGIGDNNGGNNDTGINVGQLPEFPSDSTPAETKTDAETVLAELRQSQVLNSIEEEVSEIMRLVYADIPDGEDSPDNGNYSHSYSFSDRSLPDGSVKVSYSAADNETNTGGFQTLSANWKAIDDLQDAIRELDDADPEDNTEIERLRDEIESLEEARNNIQFAADNRANYTSNSNGKWELTKAKIEDGVTVAQGSTYEYKYNESYNETVSTAGTYETFRINSTYSGKQHITTALTVTTSSGSVKIILDITEERSDTGNNVKGYGDEDDTVGTWTETEKYSG